MKLRRRAAGQGVVLFAAIMGVMFIFLVLVYNLFGFVTSALTNLDSAISSAAYGAAQQTKQVDLEAGRWYITGDNTCTGTPCTTGTLTARALLVAAIVGDQQGHLTDPVKSGNAINMFRACADPCNQKDTLAGFLMNSAGTDGLSQYGADIEILNPAKTTGQISDRWINGAQSISAGILCRAEYPQTVASTLLAGQCFDRPVVVIRIRLPVRQVGVASNDITRTGFLAVGTDVAP